MTFSLLGAILIVVGVLPLLLSLHRSPQEVSAVHLIPFSAGLLFGLPPIVYHLITGQGIAAGSSVANSYLWEGALSLSVYVILTAGLVIVLGNIRSDRWRRTAGLSRLAGISVRKILLAVAFVWIVRFYLAAEYGVFYAGSGTSAAPYLLLVAKRFGDLVAIGVFFWAIWSISAGVRRRRKLLALTVIAVEIPYVFTQGRREMFFFAVAATLVYLYARSRVSWRHLVTGGAVIVGLALFAFPLYQGTRHLIGLRTSPGGVDGDVAAYFQTVIAASGRGDLTELYVSNLEDRLASYYRWQAELASLRDRSGGLDGRLAGSGAWYSVPRFLMADKYELAWGEEVIRGAYGRDVRDVPNSVVSSGFADFGIAGVVIYAVLFVFVVWGGEAIGLRLMTMSPFLGAVVFGGSMLLALRTEISMVGVFATIRDLLLLCALAGIWGVTTRCLYYRAGRRSADAS